MATVYSHSFARGHAGSSGIIDVTPGFRRVLRFVSIFNASVIVGETFQMISTVYSYTLYKVVVSQQSSVFQDMRIVLPDDDQIQFFNDSDIDFTVSGYLLSLP